MKALVLNKLSYPDFADVDIPLSCNNNILIKMKAAAMNHRDVWITKGLYAGIVFPTILGSDGVAEWEGDRYIINPNNQWGNDERCQSKQYHILGLPLNGTFAEYLLINKDRLHKAPKHLNDAEVAALPVAGLTAFRALFKRANLLPTQKVLITGIGGGVALTTMQFALSIGAEVYITSANEEKISKAIALGATNGISYKKEKWAKELLNDTGGFDLIIDSAAGDSMADLLKLCKPGGTIVNYGGTQGTMNGLSPQILFYKQINILGSTMGSDIDFVEMLEFVNKYQIKPIVDSVFSLEQSNEAFHRMENGDQFGKIVFKI
jgi:zinc-binding alcohol dehydrogenase/oxidoreductase